LFWFFLFSDRKVIERYSERQEPKRRSQDKHVRSISANSAFS